MKKQTTPLNILLADDDKDDRFFFDKALKALTISTTLTAVEDGEKLMAYLTENSDNLPNVLFLDINMPRKNGVECLKEIKSNKKLKKLPVIMYTTSLHDDVADMLYKTGAHYYVDKRDLTDLIDILEHILNILVDSGFESPPRDKFVHAAALKHRMPLKMESHSA